MRREERRVMAADNPFDGVRFPEEELEAAVYDLPSSLLIEPVIPLRRALPAFNRFLASRTRRWFRQASRLKVGLLLPPRGPVELLPVAAFSWGNCLARAV